MSAPRKALNVVRSTGALNLFSAAFQSKAYDAVKFYFIDIFKLDQRSSTKLIGFACSVLRQALSVIHSEESLEKQEEKLSRLKLLGKDVDWRDVSHQIDSIVGKEERDNRERFRFKKIMACFEERAARFVSFGGIPGNVRKPEFWPNTGIALGKYFPHRYTESTAHKQPNHDDLWPYIPTIWDFLEGNQPAKTGYSVLEGALQYERKLSAAACIGGAFMPWVVVTKISNIENPGERVIFTHRLPQFAAARDIPTQDRTKKMAEYSISIWGQPGSKKKRSAAGVVKEAGDEQPSVGFTLLEPFSSGTEDKLIKPNEAENSRFREVLFSAYRAYADAAEMARKEREGMDENPRVLPLKLVLTKQPKIAKLKKSRARKDDNEDSDDMES